MKQLLPLLFCFFLINSAEAEDSSHLFGDWGGAQDIFEENGLSVDIVITNDTASNFSGGLKQKTINLSNFDITFGLDTEKAELWTDGQFFFYFLGNTGESTTALTGANQTLDNIEAPENFLLFEAWYEHKLFNGELSFLFGLHDYNSEFDVLHYAGTLINSSFGIQKDISQVDPSIFPVTSPAARLKYTPNDNFYFQTAIYDGIPGDPNHRHGTRINFGSDDGIFYAYELGIAASELESKTSYYKIALGGWFDSAKYQTYTGAEKRRNDGYYIIGESSILREKDDNQGLGYFIQFGSANPNNNQIGLYFGTGFQYVGAIPLRDEDILTLGMAHARNSERYTELNSSAERAETALEVSYIISITPFFSLQPDLQYVINPGSDKAIQNAFIGILRAQLAL